MERTGSDVPEDVMDSEVFDQDQLRAVCAMRLVFPFEHDSHLAELLAGTATYLGDAVGMDYVDRSCRAVPTVGSPSLAACTQLTAELAVDLTSSSTGTSSAEK